MYEIMFMLTKKLRSRWKIKHVSTKFGTFVIDLSTLLMRHRRLHKYGDRS